MTVFQLHDGLLRMYIMFLKARPPSKGELKVGWGTPIPCVNTKVFYLALVIVSNISGQNWGLVLWGTLNILKKLFQQS